MAAAIRQSVQDKVGSSPPGTLTFASTPLVGSTILLGMSTRAPATPTPANGWTALQGLQIPGQGENSSLWLRLVMAGDTATYTLPGNNVSSVNQMLEIMGGTYQGTSIASAASPDATAAGSLAVTGHGLVVALITGNYDDGGGVIGTVLTAGAGWTEVTQASQNDLNHPVAGFWTHTFGGDETSAISATASTRALQGWVVSMASFIDEAVPAVGAIALDVYGVNPPGDSITYLATLDDAFDKLIQIERNATGRGQFTINRHSAHATAAILAPGNLVKVRVPEIDDSPLFAFFLETGDFQLISSDEEGGEDITLGGRGALSYWDRAIWLAQSMVVPWWPGTMGTPPAGATGAVVVAAGTYRRYKVVAGVISGADSNGGAWETFTTTGFSAYFQARRTYQWPAASSQRFLVQFIYTGMIGDSPANDAWDYFHPHQSGVTEVLASYAVGSSILLTDIGDGDKPGETLRRMYDEGVDASRPAHPIPLMTVDFTDALDSEPVAWSTTDALAGLTAELSETYLATIEKLVGTGVLDVEMGPDLDMQAWNGPHGRDLTGNSFGAGVVRFVKGVNIADELRRARSDNPVGTYSQVVGTEGAVSSAELADAASRITREVGITAESSDPTVLAAAGLADLNARLVRSDAIGFAIATGDDDAAGLYLPGPPGSANGDFWLGDLVTLHTGTGEQDWNNATERVAAITLMEDEAGQLVVVPELGSPIGALAPGSSSTGSGSGSSGSSGSGTGVDLSIYQVTSERGAPDGYASLDAAGLVPAVELGTGTPSATTFLNGAQAFAVPDHGALGGLADDDHPQYTTAAEATTIADAEVAVHTGDATDAHDASAISVLDTAGNFTGTDVETVLDELFDAIAGGGIPATIVDAKGDLIAGSAADTAARLAAAANGASLRTASGQATGLEWQLNNLAASVAPTVNEDSGDGYSIGSRWIDTTADKEYVCLDATVGAAVWTETTASGGGASLTVEEVDASPTDSAITKIVFPNGTLGIASHVATYTPAPAGGGGGSSPFGLDATTIDATYGDEFDGTSLNGRWTATGAFKAYAARYALGGSWMEFTGIGSSAMSIYETGPSKDILEVVAAFSVNGNIGTMVGPAIVSSTGAGVLAALRSDVSNFVLNNVASYAYTSDGVAIAIGGGNAIMEYDRGSKVWISLRRFKSAASGDVYFARFSKDGNTWSKTIRLVPSAFTYAKLGFGRLYAASALVNERVSVDRFNVLNALNLGNNLVRTPTSGTPTYSASSSYGGLPASNAADGNVATEWSANSGNTDNPLYWQVAWSVGQSLNRVIFRERAGDVWGLAHLELYDGATTTYVAVDDYVTGASLWHVVEFATLTGITSMRIVSDSAAGANCGFGEVEAYLAS